MKSKLPFTAGSLVCSVFAFVALQSANAELDQEDFEVLQEALQPDPSESWRQIPWRTSLLEGQRVAVAEGKPIFIWAMDGHPLGCT